MDEPQHSPVILLLLVSRPSSGGLKSLPPTTSFSGLGGDWTLTLSCLSERGLEDESRNSLIAFNLLSLSVSASAPTLLFQPHVGVGESHAIAALPRWYFQNLRFCGTVCRMSKAYYGRRMAATLCILIGGQASWQALLFQRLSAILRSHRWNNFICSAHSELRTFIFTVWRLQANAFSLL